MRRTPVLLSLAALAILPSAARADRAFVERGLDRARAPRAELAAPTVRPAGAAGVTTAQQEVDGVPVLGATVTVTDAPGTRGDLVLDRTRAGVAAPGTPRLTRHRAVAEARRGVAGAARLRSHASLALRPEAGGRERLVWRVVTSGRRPLTALETLVDARTGEVVARRDLRREAFTASGHAQIFDPNPIVVGGGPFADDGDADSPELAAARRPRTLPRLSDRDTCLDGQWIHAYRTTHLGTDTAADVDVCDPARTFDGVERHSDDFEPLMAYFHLDRAAAYLQGLGFTSAIPFPRGAPLDVSANGDTDDNSYYLPDDGDASNGDEERIVLGTGGVDDAEDGDVIVHEYGHAIQDRQVPGFGENGATSAIGEGFGDYLAATLSEEKAAPGDQEAATCVGEWDSAPSGDACLRRTDSPLTLPEARATCDPDDDYPGEPEVHCAGQVWSAALRSLRASLGRDAAGRSVMDRVVLQSQFSVPAAGTWNDAGRALLAADQQLYQGAHFAAIRGVLRLRGVLTDTDGDGRPDAADSCPTVSDTGRDSDGDGIADACDPTPRPPGSAAKDTTAPTLVLAGYRLTTRGLAFRVRASEGASGTIALTISAATAKKLHLGAKPRTKALKVTLAAQTRRSVVLRFSAATRRALGRRLGSRVTLKLALADRAGNVARTSRIFAVRRRG